MPCPMCNKDPVTKYRPFCSNRCADLDLGKWLTGAYVIPATDTDEEDSISSDFIPNKSNLH
ncbi:MAG: DNA gyrase inhibitor YacG [Amylibacter sp.]|nr:DNA gyrase inhibitor YacG [Amylibacter sp.]|tara:strand:- start:250 stop:432 length:183 start_codon:yes stop_codon:yes gene_type:complete